MPTELLAELHDLLGPRGLLTDPADIAPHGVDWRGLYHGVALAVARPANAKEAAETVRLCIARGVAVVPQGGNTGLVGGAQPDASGAQLVLSLSRMNRVRAVDPLDLTMTVEAGVTLRAAQEAAAAAGCHLPLSISSEGTAQIGGVLAANAGGNNTLRHGNARDLVLGLEAVLPDGALWEGLRRLRKDNTGYCLRQLLVGSEGTLGVITACVLRLVPRPRQTEVAFCAMPDMPSVLAVFARLRDADPAALHAFEYMSGPGVALVLKNIEGVSCPLADPAPHYALVELSGARAGTDLRDLLEGVLEAALEAGEVADAALAGSGAQRDAMWKLREEHAEAQKREGPNLKNDVSVPVSAVPALVARGGEACRALLPGIRLAPFGHVGDGNVHFNMLAPPGMAAADFAAYEAPLTDAVNAVVLSLDGSFSAEHGVGRLKTGMMAAWRGGAELDAMRRIKRALDPQGLLNPGKVLPGPDAPPSRDAR